LGVEQETVSPRETLDRASHVLSSASQTEQPEFSADVAINSLSVKIAIIMFLLALLLFIICFLAVKRYILQPGMNRLGKWIRSTQTFSHVQIFDDEDEDSDYEAKED